ncbi:universal stress protein [Nakamurella antarctica]|uniref:Universal stress protein n=1 Tax=Nakamurella antarctica TaxID=1902245 RepID=A0A3G8ZZ05_9ACTN|nr:universal stress protein [Nakamurella antarctica]AZI59256.1 universal stress protein [Nakamurella antarctica]
MSVVVGVDGSSHSWAALTWARQEAALRGMTVEVIIAEEEPDVPEDGPEAPSATVESIAHQARERDPEAIVQIVEGNPTRALIAAGRDADLVVVGSAGLSRLHAFVHDSVAPELMGHTHAPLALVRDPASPGTGRIVVGVDEHTGDQVLGFAFTEAALRGCELRVVSTWESQILTTFGAAAVATADITAQVESAVHAMVAPFQEEYPQVRVSTLVEFGAPAAALVDEAAAADLVIVGADGSGAFARFVVGSVAQQVVHEVSVPVIVISTVRDGE